MDDVLSAVFMRHLALACDARVSWMAVRRNRK